MNDGSNFWSDNIDRYLNLDINLTGPVWEYVMIEKNLLD